MGLRRESEILKGSKASKGSETSKRSCRSWVIVYGVEKGSLRFGLVLVRDHEEIVVVS